MSFLEHIESDRRLVILISLTGMPGYEANEHVLHAYLDDYGHNGTREQLRQDIAYLEKYGLVKAQVIGGKVTVATLTEKGDDVAKGRTTCPGVKRPAPGG